MFVWIKNTVTIIVTFHFMKLQVKKCPERKIYKSFDLIKNSITRLQIFRATTKFVVIPRVYFSLGFFSYFLKNFLDSIKGSPFVCFDILQHHGCQKFPKDPPFYIFRHCDTVQKSYFKFFLGNFHKFLKGPLFFHILQPTGVSQSPKGPPFTILSLRFSADFGRSRLVLKLYESSLGTNCRPTAIKG